MNKAQSGEGKIRVLHCPTIVGGNPYGMARAERKVGLESRCVVLQNNHFDYRCDEVLTKKPGSYLELEIKRWNLLYRAVRYYDIIHFNFGESIMPKRRAFPSLKDNFQRIFYWLYQPYASILELKDLPLLKRMGKGIVVTYQGSDARQDNYCRENYEICIAKEVSREYYNSKRDAYIRKRIEGFSKYADRIFSLNPDLLNVLPSSAKFLPYAHVDLREWDVTENIGKHVFTLVHAPTNRDVKGTKYIISAVERLKSEGVKFDFVLVEGMTNKEAKEIYKRADLLVDQLLAGWYGGICVELMALGKPVIAYIREEDLKYIPKEMKNDIPVINATPSSIYQVLKYYISENRGELKNIGKKGREYVEKWHDPARIASHMKSVYEEVNSNRKRKFR